MEEIVCHKEMEQVPRVRDPEREEERAVADRASAAPAPERAGGRVKAQEEARVRAGVRVKAQEGARVRVGAKAKGARGRARAVDAAKAVNRPRDMI